MSLRNGGKLSASDRRKVFDDLLKTANETLDGVVTHEDFCAALRRNDVDLEEAETRRLFRELDTDGDGKVVLGRDAVKRKAAKAFEAYDANKDGLVSKAEMARLSGTKLSRAQIVNIFKHLDRDADGFLSRAELTDVMIRASAEKQNK